jgi:hypothetical protein
MYVKILKTMCRFKNGFTGVVKHELKKKREEFIFQACIMSADEIHFVWQYPSVASTWLSLV